LQSFLNKPQLAIKEDFSSENTKSTDHISNGPTIVNSDSGAYPL